MLKLTTPLRATLLRSEPIPVEEFKCWRTSFELDPVKRIRGVSAIAYVVLLDEQGQMMTCSGDGALSAIGWLDAPEDQLLATRKLDVVVYEKGKPTPKK